MFKRSRGGRSVFKGKRRGGSGFGSAGDFSYVSVSGLGRGRRFLGRVEKALASKTVKEVLGSARLESNVNQQGILWVPLCFSDSLRNAFSTTVGTTPNEGGKLYVEYASLRMQLVNQANVPTTVWIYDICLRRDEDDALTPSQDWERGIIQQGGAANDYLLPYSTPFKSSRFCVKWKIKKVTKAFLNPGESHVHTLRINVYNYIAQQRIYDATGSHAGASYGVGGLSHMVAVVILGGVVNDDANKLDVGYSNAAIDAAYTATYRVCALFDDRKRYTKTSTLPSITTGSTMVEVDADPSAIVTA